MMMFPTPLPPLFPRLTYRIPHAEVDQDASQSLFAPISLTHDQNSRNGRSPHDDKYLSDIDRDEIALEARVPAKLKIESNLLTPQNMRIAIHGRTYLRPPGLDPYAPPGLYGDQEQPGNITQLEESFMPDEDERGFALNEVEEDEEEDEFEDETLEEEQVVHPKSTTA